MAIDSVPSVHYQQHPELEYLGYYVPGGYHPVQLLDNFKQGRYTAVHKLGHGGFATVWLVRDNLSDRYASMKILTAKASQTSSELAIMRQLRTRTKPHEHVVRSLDEFEHEGPNGVHHCIITEVLGPSLASFELNRLLRHRGLPPDMGRRIAVQLASAVAYLHEHDVVHHDIHLGNVLLYPPSASSWNTQDDIDRWFDPPTLFELLLDESGEKAPATPHAPEYAIFAADTFKFLSQCLDTDVEDETNECITYRVHIKICDFSESFISTTPPQVRRSGCPILYRAPEIIFDGMPSIKSDIWALAVITHQLICSGLPLFPSYHSVKHEILCQMVIALGKFPRRWWERWAERKEYFDDDGRWSAPVTFRRENERTGDILRHWGARLTQQEEYALRPQLLAMTAYEPEQRTDARTAADCFSKLWSSIDRVKRDRPFQMPKPVDHTLELDANGELVLAVTKIDDSQPPFYRQAPAIVA